MIIYDENNKLVYANENTMNHYNCNSINELLLVLKENSFDLVNENEILTSIKLNKSWQGLIKNNAANKVFNCNIQLIEHQNNKKYLCVSYMNITEILNNELEFKKVKEYDKEKSEFIANISHELKTPLNIFSSNIQLLDSFVENNTVDFKDVYKKYNKTLHTNCARMTRLVDNIIDLSKFDLGVINTNFANYDIVNIIEEVTLSVVKYTQLKNINILFDTNKEEHIIACDANMIEKALLNLLSNAIKFSNPDSCVYVNLLIHDDAIEIIVQDEGIGISDENQRIIFEKFVQVDKSFTRKCEGSGIGLSIVKNVVDIHDGKITIESKLNKGTTFRVFLPNTRKDDNILVQYSLNEYNVKLELSDIYELLT